MYISEVQYFEEIIITTESTTDNTDCCTIIPTTTASGHFVQQSVLSVVDSVVIIDLFKELDLADVHCVTISEHFEIHHSSACADTECPALYQAVSHLDPVSHSLEKVLCFYTLT